ncbi:MAG: hypothetical protein DLM64_01905 [Solirubrobacterales bacterium]|nr:MAG: hypothetical protein DLM64_01905 [Solirubrobacterales bacterium]
MVPLGTHARQTACGVTFGAETGFLLARDPDTVRAPDAAFVSAERADAVGRTERYWPGAPDLAVEVLSPSDSFREVEAKALDWLHACSRAVLVLDPARAHGDRLPRAGRCAHAQRRGHARPEPRGPRLARCAGRAVRLSGGSWRTIGGGCQRCRPQESVPPAGIEPASRA